MSQTTGKPTPRVPVVRTLRRPHRARREVTRFCLSTISEIAPTAQKQAYRKLSRNWQPDRPDAYCSKCGCTALPQTVTASGCPTCLTTNFEWTSVTRLSEYADPVRGWLHAMKFHRGWSWGPWFGKRLGGAIAIEHARLATTSAAPSDPSDQPGPVLCPVPMHWRRRWRRGFNQAQIIADAAARELNWPVAPVLRRTRHTMPQSLVDTARRRQNVAGSIAPHFVDLQHREVWLIDDVKTTGATLNLCAHLLRQMNAGSVRVAVVAVANPE